PDQRREGNRRASEAVGLGPEPESPFDATVVARAIRAAVIEHCELRTHTVLLLQAGTIPKTSSGKVQRFECREGFARKQLNVVAKDELSNAVTQEEVGHTTPLRRFANAERPSVLEQHVLTELARVLDAGPGGIDWDAPLSSLGLDSLAAVEIAH